MSGSDRGTTGVTRRGVLRGGAAVATATAAGTTVPTAAAQPEFDGWFDDVANYDGVVDRRDEDRVTVEVGVDNGDGPYGFGPAAVQISPGTTVEWVWTGRGGSHNVVPEGDADFESELVSTEGHTYDYTFETEGVHRYYCVPHRQLGMKGAVVVGSLTADVPEPDYEGWFDDVANYGGTVDRREAETVSVEVGVQNGDGPYGYGPAAVRVSPGATVRWEWTGRGGSHNVVAEDADFESELVSTEGHTYDHTFETEGVYRYYCTPHRQLGMKGAVVVGDVGDRSGGAADDATGGPGVVSRLLPNTAGEVMMLLTMGALGLVVAMVAGTEVYADYRGHVRREAAVAGERPVEAPAEEPAVEVGDDYDPWGTLALVLGYLALIALLWVFMYFVEFLGGPTIAR